MTEKEQMGKAYDELVAVISNYPPNVCLGAISACVGALLDFSHRTDKEFAKGSYAEFQKYLADSWERITKDAKK